MNSSRLLILLNFAFLPIRLLGLVLSIAYMVVTAPLLLVCMVVLLLPAELLWACSPFVGLIYPPAGTALADTMDWASDALAACMDFIYAPLGFIGDWTVFYDFDA